MYSMNRSGTLLYRSVRTYATKSKTTNMKMKPSVPVQQTTLSDGIVFLERRPAVDPAIQATAAPLLHRNSTKASTSTKKLTESEIAEMRQLRESDPETWTRSKLAEKFGCSPLFVSIAAPLPKQILQQRQEQKNAADSIIRGYRRKLITEQRQKRRELW